MFDLDKTNMTSDDRSRSKMKAWKIYLYVYQIRSFNGADFKNGVYFAKKAFLTSYDLHDRLDLDLRWFKIIAL